MRGQEETKMTDLEKKLFEMLDDILDGIVYFEDLVRMTGLSENRCQQILHDYYEMKTRKDG